MGHVPVLKPREVAALLVHLGFQEVRQRGSHRQHRHPDGRGTTVDLGFPSRTVRSELPPRPSLRNDQPILAYGTDVLSSTPEDVLVHVFDGAAWSPAIRAHGLSVVTRATPQLAVGGGRVFVTHKGSDNLAEVLEVLFP